MEDIKKLVEELEKITKFDENHEEKQIKILQQINQMLLSEYIIKIGDVTIEPILVEAYYYHEDKFKGENTHGFKDDNCRKLQSNRFNKLYFHRRGYGGVDICLSRKENHCLSFLIKNSIVSNVGFCTQTQLYSFMKKELTKQLQISFEELENTNNILCRNHRESDIINTVRKGLTTGSFKNKSLASLPINIIKNYPFTLEKGHSKAYLIKEYLKKESKKSITPQKRVQLEELRKNYMSYEDFNKLFGDNI